MASIYALIDPLTDKIRYIGLTYRKRVKVRYNEHIYQATVGKGSNIHCGNWIRKLMTTGNKPILKILLNNIDDEIGGKTEQNFIKHYKQFCKLTNLTEGGEGTVGLKHTEEHKMKIRESGVYEKARLRMLGNDNPGKSRKKTVFYTPTPDEEKIKQRMRCSERMKVNNPGWRNRKPIIQMTIDGQFIKEWESGETAAKFLELDSSNINRCANKKIKTSNGFIWKFKEELENVI